MSILHSHVPYYREIFEIPGVLAEPLLVFGFQDVAIRRIFRQPWESLSPRKKLKRAWKSLRYEAEGICRWRNRDYRVPEEFWAKELQGIERTWLPADGDPQSIQRVDPVSASITDATSAAWTGCATATSLRRIAR